MHDLALSHVDVLAQRGAADAEAKSLDRAAVARQLGRRAFGKAPVVGDLQCLDIAVADQGDAAHARRARQRVVADAGIPSLGIDRVGRSYLVAYLPVVGLVLLVGLKSVVEIICRVLAS